MAKITTSANAPAELVEYGFASGSFKLRGGEVYETDNRALIASARIHPWLKVEYDKVELISGQVRDTLANHPTKDVMTSEHKDAGIPFDPEAIAKAEEEKAVADDMPLAVDANLKQDVEKTVGVGDYKTAVTLSADDAPHEPSDKKSDGVEPTDDGADAAPVDGVTPVDDGPQPSERDVAEPGPRNVTDKTKGS